MSETENVRSRILLASVVLGLGVLALLWASARASMRGGPAPEPVGTSTTEVADLVAAAPTGARLPTEARGSVPRPTELPAAVVDAVRAARAAKAAGDPADPPAVRWLTGRLLLADGTPASGDALRHVAHDARMRHAGEAPVELGPFGDFRIDLQPEHHGVRLLAKVRDHAPLDRWIPLDPEPGARDLGIVVLSAGGSIAGEARLGAADPRGWNVLVMTSDPELPVLLPRSSARTTYPGPDGRFELRNVPVGPARLSLHHPVLGTVMERDVVVREGAVTRVDLVHDGHDPARLLVVQVDAARAPRADEIWLEDEHGMRLRPETIEGFRVVFAELAPLVPHALVLALEEEELPVRRDGVLAGARTTIRSRSREAVVESAAIEARKLLERAAAPGDPEGLFRDAHGTVELRVHQPPKR